MHKIKISRIQKKIFSHKGFDPCGCYGSSCNDSCCSEGADIDRESYALIIKHRKEIEALIKSSVGKCFSRKWGRDDEYLGKGYIRSRMKKGFCIFHLSGEKGCALFRLSQKKGISRRIIPSICRLYPLSWNKGRLYIHKSIKSGCGCLSSKSELSKSVFETQKKEIDEIFKIKLKRKK
ncbi:MAG: hypothetical protein NTV63_04405 [Candidatus Woesearchaeota archaeon]|nr:hypothetical protein [Candidatus Woesearchaeota archaeon]